MQQAWQNFSWDAKLGYGKLQLSLEGAGTGPKEPTRTPISRLVYLILFVPQYPNFVLRLPTGLVVLSFF